MNRTPVGALRVLVVDDNEDARKSLCWMLTLLGHTTQQADSGKAALETAARSLPDGRVRGRAATAKDARRGGRPARGRHGPL
jgi:hypothetical protein